MELGMKKKYVIEIDWGKVDKETKEIAYFHDGRSAQLQQPLTNLPSDFEATIIKRPTLIWYENITKPVLCWVWGENKSYKRYHIVTKYSSDEKYPFSTVEGISYKNAVPLTDKEVDSFKAGF